MLFKPKDKVIFTAYDDLAWGQEYGGKVAVVEDTHEYEDYQQEVDIVFEDGKHLGVLASEVMLYKDFS